MSTSALRILAIDDQQGVLAALREDLEDAGHTVFTARSGQAGLELAGQERPDAVLLDVNMPEMDGLQVLRALKELAETATIPIILLTGDHDLDLMKQGFQLGATDYLRKPYNFFELQTRVMHIVRLKQANDRIHTLLEAQRLQAVQEQVYTRTTFQRYLAPEIVDELLSSADKPLEQSRRRFITVLFSDVQDFTRLSERLPAEQVVAMLNEYLEQMAAVVIGNEGLLDKYMGDGLMAWWGYRVPNDPGQEAYNAIKAAIEMQDVMEALRARWQDQGLGRVAIRVGVHSGDAVVGNIGSNQRMDYTAIGDTVNLAARLEGLNKEFNTRVMISEDTYSLVRDRVEARFLAVTRVKGKEQDVQAYELLGLAEPAGRP